MTEENGIKVLIVEDNSLAAMAAKMMLQAKGCQTEVATSGEEALKEIDDSFALVIMDIGLPGIDGYEAARQIRAGNVAADVPIIALTAHEDNEEKIAIAKQAGMNGFLLKPLTTEVCDAILEYLNTRASADFFRIVKS